MTPEEYGDKLIALGTAIKNPDSTVGEVVRLAKEVGMVFATRLDQLPEAEGDKP